MRTLKDFDNFSKDDLKTLIIEKKKGLKKSNNLITQFLTYFIFFFFIQTCFIVLNFLPSYSLLISLFLFIGPYLYLYLYFYDKTFENKLRDDALKSVCTFIDENAELKVDSCVDIDTFLDSRLFLKIADDYQGSHLVCLRDKNISLTFSWLSVNQKKGKSSTPIFRGLFGYAEFETTVHPNYFRIYSNSYPNTLPFHIKQAIQKNLKWEDNTILIPKWIFNKYFNGYGKSCYPIAKHIFSTEVINQLYKLYIFNNKPIAFTLKDNKCYFALSGAHFFSKKSLFLTSKPFGVFKNFYNTLFKLSDFLGALENEIFELYPKEESNLDLDIDPNIGQGLKIDND